MGVRASLVIIIILACRMVYASPCVNPPLNVITDVAYNCMFPFYFMGIPSQGNSDFQDSDHLTSATCGCQSENGLVRPGVSASFWVPMNIIDTVSKPYCFMPLGTSITPESMGMLNGSMVSSSQMGNNYGFAQAHYYSVPIWGMLDMYQDIPCIDWESQFDVLYMSEFDPLWNNDLLSLIVNPEALLFGNPVTVYGCIADALSATVFAPINTLFWCMGSWGLVYPTTGSVVLKNIVEANAAVASKVIYRLNRLQTVLQTSDNGCGAYFPRVWSKNQYRLQLWSPFRDRQCVHIGKSGHLWANGKHPPIGSDNFSWIVWRKVKCCIFGI